MRISREIYNSILKSVKDIQPKCYGCRYTDWNDKEKYQRVYCRGG